VAFGSILSYNDKGDWQVDERRVTLNLGDLLPSMQVHRLEQSVDSSASRRRRCSSHGAWVGPGQSRAAPAWPDRGDTA
jgi:hypothetical protein